jgi:hypothetical protein
LFDEWRWLTVITFTFNKLQCDLGLIYNLFYNNVLNSNLSCMIMICMTYIFIYNLYMDVYWLAVSLILSRFHTHISIWTMYSIAAVVKYDGYIVHGTPSFQNQIWEQNSTKSLKTSKG